MHINRVICTSRTHPIFCGSKAFSNYQKPSSGVLSNCFLFSKRFQFSGIVREFVWGDSLQFNLFNIWLIYFSRGGGSEMGCSWSNCNTHHRVKMIGWCWGWWWADDLLMLVGKWADPGGTAMPGQPATRPEQAPEPHPLAKISLISKGAHGPRIRY